MEPLALGAAIAAALAGAGYMAMPPKSRSSGGRQGRRVQSRRLPASHGPGGFNPIRVSDLSLKTPSMFNVPRSVPHNIAGLLAWDSLKVDSVINTSTSAITETNFNFLMSAHPQVSSWLALFDQYSIPMASVEFDSQIPPGSTSTPPTLYTALDWDNVTNLGSVASIEDYSSSEAVVLSTAGRHLRTVRPSCKTALLNNSAGTSYSGVEGPVWVDSTTNNIPFFGIRSIVSVTPGGSTIVKTTTTIWYCFRNQI